MTSDELQAVKLGDRVRFTGDGMNGTVFAMRKDGFEIKWDDGEEGLVLYSHMGGNLEKIA